jgi:hypothetical protein
VIIVLIDILDLLPKKCYVKIEETFRKILFDKCIIKAGTVTNLAKILKTRRQDLNKLRWGWQRISFKNFIFLLEYANFLLDNMWDTIEEFGLQGQKIGLKLPRFFEINEDFVWFIGVRHGDRAENQVQVGICNSDMDILQKFCEILFAKGFKPSELNFYVYVKDKKIRERLKRNIKKFCKDKETNIKFYFKTDKEMYIMIQLNNALFHKIAYKIEEKLDDVLNNSQNFKAAYVRGFIDAEGCVDHHGCIIVTQKLSKVGKKNTLLIKKLLEELSIESHIRRDGYKKLRLIMNKESLESYVDLIGFCSKRKMNELKIIQETYKKKYDKRNIENEILKLAKKPVTRREIILALKSKYDKTGSTIRKLEKEGKIKIINKRPLTVVFSKEVQHDLLANHL